MSDGGYPWSQNVGTQRHPWQGSASLTSGSAGSLNTLSTPFTGSDDSSHPTSTTGYGSMGPPLSPQMTRSTQPLTPSTACSLNPSTDANTGTSWHPVPGRRESAQPTFGALQGSAFSITPIKKAKKRVSDIQSVLTAEEKNLISQKRSWGFTWAQEETYLSQLPRTGYWDVKMQEHDLDCSKRPQAMFVSGSEESARHVLRKLGTVEAGEILSKMDAAGLT